MALRAAVSANAERHARDLGPVLADIRRYGATSLRGMLTRRGWRWHVSTVMNLLDRLGRRDAAIPADVALRSRGQRVVGYGLAVATQIVVFPLFGLVATIGHNLAIGEVFTLVSLVRSYLLRRTFGYLR